MSGPSYAPAQQAVVQQPYNISLLVSVLTPKTTTSALLTVTL